MQTIRRSLLVVPFFFMSVCSLTQQRTDIHQSLIIVDEITFDSYALNPFSGSDNKTDLTPDNRNNDNNSHKVKQFGLS